MENPNRKIYIKKWVEKNIEKVKLYKKKWAISHREKINGYSKKYDKEKRLRTLAYYSKGTFSCACCKENHIEFLCLDHINGDGNKHRRSIGNEGRGGHIYQWIIKNNFPKGFRVLCHNCNMSLGFYGYCPHKNKQTPL